MDYDAIIIGARVAGSSLAILLGRQGKRVLPVDRDCFPSDTLSTHLLQPPAVEMLDRLGALAEVESSGLGRLGRLRAYLGDVVVEGPLRAPGAYALCARRDRLDMALMRQAVCCDGCHVGAAPLDARLGLGRGMLSPGLARVAGRVGIEAAFAPAAGLLRETLRIDVAEAAVRRLTEGIGAVAEAEQQAAMEQAAAGRAPPPDAGEVPPTALLVEVDGVQVPVERSWNEMKVGVVAPLGPATETDPESGRVRLAVGRQSACAGFEPAQAFWYRVYAEACRRGLGLPSLTLVVLLGDGADWIWRYGRQFLALKGVELVEIVDLFHAVEHLWAVAHAVFGASSPRAAAWVAPLKGALLTEGVGPVLAALDALALGAEPEAAEEVRKATGYFTTNAARMIYPRFLARRLPIGSGAVECACKTLVQARAKQAGMRWSRAGVRAVVSLRAMHRSGRWEQFWRTRPQRRRPAVFPRRGAVVGFPAQLASAAVPAPPDQQAA